MGKTAIAAVVMQHDTHAFGLTQTSRLGCQIEVTDELDGLVVSLPVETRNMMV